MHLYEVRIIFQFAVGHNFKYIWKSLKLMMSIIMSLNHFMLSVFLFFFFWETFSLDRPGTSGSHYVNQAGLQIQSSTWILPPSAGVKGAQHSIQPESFYWITYISWDKSGKTANQNIHHEPARQLALQTRTQHAYKAHREV